MIDKIELELSDGRVLLMAERINGKLFIHEENVPVWHKNTEEVKKVKKVVKKRKPKQSV